MHRLHRAYFYKDTKEGAAKQNRFAAPSKYMYYTFLSSFDFCSGSTYRGLTDISS